jgi:hypothetical protein
LLPSKREAEHGVFKKEKLNMAPLKKEKGWALQSTHNFVPFLRWQRRLYVAMASSNEPL